MICPLPTLIIMDLRFEDLPPISAHFIIYQTPRVKRCMQFCDFPTCFRNSYLLSLLGSTSTIGHFKLPLGCVFLKMLHHLCDSWGVWGQGGALGLLLEFVSQLGADRAKIVCHQGVQESSIHDCLGWSEIEDQEMCWKQMWISRLSQRG